MGEYGDSLKLPDIYLAHVIEQPIFGILNILFVYFFIDFFVKHIFFEARLERVIQGISSGFVIMYLALEDRNMQVRFGLKVVGES